MGVAPEPCPSSLPDAQDPAASLAEGSRDYVAAVSTLEERYLQQHGEVYTFGSGECGQLAHGCEEEKDLISSLLRLFLARKKIAGTDEPLNSWLASGAHAERERRCERQKL